MSGTTDVKPKNYSNELVTVVHRLSHRTRLRIKKSPDIQQYLSKAEAILKDTPGVEKIEVNPHTGSLLILHDDHSSSELENSIAQITQTIGELMPIADDGGLIYMSNSVYPLVQKIDQKISQWSDNTVDLKALIPFALAYLGLRKVSETGSLLGDISPFVLLYYAFDSYHKLHRKGEFGPALAESNGR